MLALTGFPPEVLVLILEWTDLDTVTLWLAGDALLNARIARYCTIVRTPPPWHSFKGVTYAIKNLSVWPRILSSFSALQTLKIQATRVIGFDIAQRIRELPPSLTELHLEFSGANGIPFLNENEKKALQPLDTANPSALLRGYILGTDHSVCWRFAEHFPRLRKLVLAEVDRASFWQTSQSIMTSNLGIFPPTLTHLTWHAYIKYNCDFSLLPSSVTALEFGRKDNLQNLTEMQFNSLPTSLTSLKGIQFSPDILEFIPKGLKHCTVYFNPYYVNVNFGFTLERLTKLPPTLECLPCFMVASPSAQWSQWAPSLPANLTHLDLGMPPLSPADILLLPQSLTRLKAQTPNYLPVLAAELEKPNRFWPVSLTSFEYSSVQTTPISPTCLIAFPRNLTELITVKVAGTLGDVQRVFADLPPSLRTLSMEMSLNSDVELESPLPASLTSLKLTGFSLAPSSLPMLPSGMTALSLPHTVYNAGDIEAFALPASLKELQIEILDETSFPSLPPSFTLLETATGTTEFNNKTHIVKSASKNINLYE